MQTPPRTSFQRPLAKDDGPEAPGTQELQTLSGTFLTASAVLQANRSDPNILKLHTESERLGATAKKSNAESA